MCLVVFAQPIPTAVSATLPEQPDDRPSHREQRIGGQNVAIPAEVTNGDRAGRRTARGNGATVPGML